MIGIQNLNSFLRPRGMDRPITLLNDSGRDPFNQTFWKFRSKTQWIGSVQPEKFRKNGSTFWDSPLFPVGPVGILVEWIAPSVCWFEASRNIYLLVSFWRTPNAERRMVSRFPGGYSHTSPIRVCAAQRGRDFEAPDLERGIHFRGVF